MSLSRESVVIPIGYQIGDTKVANYDISFTVNQLVEPELGWFLLNGAVISQTTYPTLFARYGASFNTGGEGAGNFRLPNHTEGVFPITQGLSNFTTYAASGGAINALTDLPSHGHTDSLTISANGHNHSASITAANQGTTAHSYSVGTVTAQTPAGTSNQIDAQSYPLTSSSGGGSHVHSLTALSISATTESYNKSGSLGTTGSSALHNNMMPFIVVGGLLVKHD